mmetsp:Transcript_21560/g.18588  ORF Transcript_21560/g.18588 Transcript_21560/m.18588 type:complete len:86 (+) Transcript_21560:1439-1696(+)
MYNAPSSQQGGSYKPVQKAGSGYYSGSGYTNVNSSTSSKPNTSTSSTGKTNAYGNFYQGYQPGNRPPSQGAGSRPMGSGVVVKKK